MRTTFLRLAAVAALVVAGVVGTTGPASAAPSSGVNDWTCRPSAAHPRPVVLWHGLGANAGTNFATLGPAIAAKDYCVFSMTYGTTSYGPFVGGLASMRASAEQLATFVDKVRNEVGVSEVDVVGHSEGTTVPAYYFKFLGGASKVNRFVGFGSNFKGTSLQGLQTLADLLGFRPVLEAGGCTACNEFAPDSTFNADLNDGGVTVPGVDYTSIVTKYDTVVTPYASGVLAPAANVTNITLQDVCQTDFSGHVGLAVDPNIAAIVLNRLDPAAAAPVRCVPMPFLG